MFIDMFGVTPSNYLRLRRLHRLRAALLMTNAGLSTVAGLCDQFHLPDHGRAARDYRVLFGEFPSQTLARSPGEIRCTEAGTSPSMAAASSARADSTPPT
jgi:transcriptional regulator GlxA family with amidase domain